MKIDKFGYAVVLIRPQRLIKVDKSGDYIDEVKENVNRIQIDEKYVKELAYLINLTSKKRTVISSFF
jgi:hypothetical protein